MRSALSAFLFGSLLATGLAVPAGATTLQLFYTNGNTGVFESTYDSTTNTLTPTKSFTSLNPSADGILLGPNGTFFYSTESTNVVFQLKASDGTAVAPGATGTSPSFLLAQNQNNPTSVFTFNNAGQLSILPIVAGLITNGTSHTITAGAAGAPVNVSDLVWSATNAAYYVTGGPGTTGAFGTFNVGTFQTGAPIATGLNYAQDAVYDPFNGLFILTGNGQVNTFNPTTNTFGTAITLSGASVGGSCAGTGASQFDTAAVSGAGQAIIAGCGNLYFFDYSATNNILSALDVTKVLTGVGAKDPAIVPITPVPEPSMAGLLAFGAGLLAFGRSRRRKA